MVPGIHSTAANPDPASLGDKHVVVVGGAIGGTAAALLMAGAGAQVTLLERVPEPRAVGAGILLQPNDLAVLSGLGLREPLGAAGVRVRFGAVRDGSWRRLMAMETPDYGEGLDHMMVIRRSDLLTTLLDAVEAQSSIEARYGATVRGATRDGLVSIERDGQTETLQADLVIGADGIHSAVREQGDFGARLTRTGISYVRGLSPTTLQADESSESWTNLGIFGMAPLGTGSYFFTSAGHPLLADALQRRDLAAFRAAWAGAFPRSRPLLDPLEHFDDLLVNEVAEVECTHFFDGRLVLLGDAAHAMAPNLGQGANSALVDAAVLVHELRQSPDWPDALRRYDARRRPTVTRVQRTAHRLGAAAELHHPVPPTLRDTALRLLSLLPGSAERAARDAQQEDPAWLLRATRSAASPLTAA